MKIIQLPDYLIEYKVRSQYGENIVIVGLDEVGRGALAGPVYASAVCIHKDKPIYSRADHKYEIKDSKLLTPQKRKNVYTWIRGNCHAFGVGGASVEEINKQGIVAATVSAFDRAVGDLQNRHSCRVDLLLVDGDKALADRITRNVMKESFIGGDRRILSIAAASIVAKVERDSYMQNLSKQKDFAKYDWYQNKGYGTRKHIEAIKKHGPSVHHRELFLRKILK